VGNRSSSKSKIIRVTAEPGICGFPCVIEARRTGRYTVSIKIKGSECKHGQLLSGIVKKMTMKELFAPVTRNPVFLSAQRAGCHPSCPIPVAILKAVEVAMEMALPRDAVIRFE
jgi:hypothetical protein